MKNYINWALLIFIVGHVIILKFGSYKLLDNYILSSIILFIVLIIIRLIYIIIKPKTENYSRIMFQSIFSLTVLIVTLIIYILYP